MNPIVYEEREVSNIFSPAVWGESLWFLLHLGSLAAENRISRADAKKYWNYIEGIPLMLPCKECAKHAQIFINHCRPYSAEICSSRANLVQFYVDFHNYVNLLQNKPLITVQDVERLAHGGTRLATIKYF